MTKQRKQIWNSSTLRTAPQFLYSDKPGTRRFLRPHRQSLFQLAPLKTWMSKAPPYLKPSHHHQCRLSWPNPSLMFSSEFPLSFTYSMLFREYSCFKTTTLLHLLSRQAHGNVKAPCYLKLRPDWLSVTTSKKIWISQQMEAEMNPVFNFVRFPEFHN